jgi:hypothetical protein
MAAGDGCNGPVPGVFYPLRKSYCAGRRANNHWKPAGGFLPGEVDEYYSCDNDISACAIPDIINVKSIIIRCGKLENYSKTYAMAISKDGRVFDYINSSTREIK